IVSSCSCAMAVQPAMLALGRSQISPVFQRLLCCCYDSLERELERYLYSIGLLPDGFTGHLAIRKLRGRMVGGVFNIDIKAQLVAIRRAIFDVEPLLIFRRPSASGHFFSVLGQNQKDRLRLRLSFRIGDRYCARPFAADGWSGRDSRKQETENHRKYHECFHNLVLLHRKDTPL